MHKLLSRQIKRVLGVEEARVPVVLEEFRRLIGAGTLSEEAARMLGGLEIFSNAWTRLTAKVTVIWN